jgi:hypothetical protein
MANSDLEKDIVRRLRRLPPAALRELRDVLNLLEEQQTMASDSSLLEAAGQLSGDPMTADEIEQTLYGRGEANE